MQSNFVYAKQDTKSQGEFSSLPVDNIHENNQTELMSSINQWLEFIWSSKAATRCEKVGNMVPAKKN